MTFNRIAAANVEIEGTDVCALTLHALFACCRRRKRLINTRMKKLQTCGDIFPHMDLDGELQTRLDLSKMDNEKTKQLMALDVLLLDSLRTMVAARSVCAPFVCAFLPQLF